MTQCNLCAKGFPIGVDGRHHGTQPLGMIPSTPCEDEVRHLKQIIEITEGMLNSYSRMTKVYFVAEFAKTSAEKRLKELADV